MLVVAIIQTNINQTKIVLHFIHTVAKCLSDTLHAIF